MSEPDETLRRLVAAEHGLDAEAAAFLTGSTLAELDASADALAKLLGERREERREQEPIPNFLAAAAAAKAERKRALVESLTGRSSQPRDERGRFTGFDGGARQPAPTRRAPEQEHNELVTKLALLSRAYGVHG